MKRKYFLPRLNERWIDISIYLLSIFGIFMIGSASIGDVDGGTAETVKLVGKQIIFCFFAFFVKAWVQKKFSCELLQRRVVNTPMILFGGLMIFCFFMPEVNGAKAWIPLGFMTLQPSEFVKIAIPCFLAYYFVKVPQVLKIESYMSDDKKVEVSKSRFMKALVQPLAACIAIFGICVFIQNDTGTSFVIAFITMACFFVASHKMYRKYQQIIGRSLVGLGAVLLLFGKKIIQFLPSYMQSRFTSWLNPMGDVYGSSYQLVNGLIAFSNNGLTGLGFGNSTQKFGYIPEAYNDFITSIIFEETGIFGLALIIFCFSMIIYQLFKYAFLVKDERGKIVLIGLASYFFFHLLLNLGGVSGFIPLTGVPLLCVSAGGSSLVACYIGVGIAQGIIRHYKMEERDHESTNL